jgi:hypothetical protein
MADLQTPYSTAMPYVVSASSAGWTDEYDRQRLLSYNLYDDLFNNDPSTFRLLLRGTNEKPIYVPTAKKLIKSLSRYVGKGWGYTCVANAGDELAGIEASSDEQLQLAQSAFGNLFARERLLSVYRASVPEWLRRGDWLWFVSANPGKREGSRISVRTIDPRRYFPLFNDMRDLSRVTGQQLIEETLLPDGKTLGLLVQTWLKWTDPGHPNYTDDPNAVEPEDGYDITYEVQAYDLQDFGDPAKRKKLAHTSNLPQTPVAGIKTLPIYHIRNNESTDNPFGTSDLAGLEAIIAGINQATSDEDLSLALMGIGQYWTNSGPPVDEATKQPTAWKLGPNRVIEVDEDAEFNKVEGITSVEPFQDHIGYISDEAAGTMGLSDVSIGTADSATADSGIALSIRFSPTIDAVNEKNDASNAVITQMFHDLKTWFLVYEGYDMGSVDILSVTSSEIIPFDREARWKELMEGVTAKVFTPEYAVQVLTEEFGYVFPSDYLSSLKAANDAAAAALDPFAARAGAELAAGDTTADAPAE